jgi:predicted HicB family RNase H-like nuclease
MSKKKNKFLLKEKFISKFCKERGWNPKELTTGQMLFIISQPDYKLI